MPYKKAVHDPFHSLWRLDYFAVQLEIRSQVEYMWRFRKLAFSRLSSDDGRGQEGLDLAYLMFANYLFMLGILRFQGHFYSC